MDTKKNRKNTVATVLQVYAIANAICGVILALVVGGKYNAAIGILYCAACIVASYLLYAFGEVVKLLHEIKLNTGNTTKAEESDEVVLPEL